MSSRGKCDLLATELKAFCLFGYHIISRHDFRLTEKEWIGAPRDWSIYKQQVLFGLVPRETWFNIEVRCKI